MTDDETRTPADEFHDHLIDELHNANLIFQVIPDEGDDEQWVSEVSVADLMMLAERAFVTALSAAAVRYRAEGWDEGWQDGRKTRYQGSGGNPYRALLDENNETQED